MHLWQWILLPFVAAAIGWFTNFLAVRMLFRPYRPVRVLGFSIQGLLPKRRKDFAQSIGATVEEHLVSAEDIKALLRDPETHGRMEELLTGRIDRFFDEKVVAAAPMLAPFLKGSLVDSIKQALVRESSEMLLASAGMLGESLDHRLDLKAMVERKILDFDFHQLERIVLNVARTELRWIEILGAVLGFLVGLGQILIFLLFGGGS